MKTVYLLSLFIAAVIAETPTAFLYNQYPVLLTPGQNFTVSFLGEQGSQFAIYVPSNISRLYIDWKRSETSLGCLADDIVYLLAKYGSYPCSRGVGRTNSQCTNNANRLVWSQGQSGSVVLNAASSGLQYWKNNINGYDFIRDDYLYFSGEVEYPTACTATVSIHFDYCPEGTIATESDSDTVCEPYTKVTNASESTYVETGSLTEAPYQQFWLVTVPPRASGIGFTIKDAEGSIFMFERYSSAGTSLNCYLYDCLGYNHTITTAKKDQPTSYYHYSPVPSAGEFVLTFLSWEPVPTFTVNINVSTCPDGLAADYRDCNSQTRSIDPSTLTQTTLNVSSDAVDYLEFQIPARTWAYFDLTLLNSNTSSPDTVYLRRNAWSSDIYFDDVFKSGDTINFTPEDLYSEKNTTWYLAFYTMDYSVSMWTVSGNWRSTPPTALPSTSPVPAASTSPVVCSHNTATSATFSMLLIVVLFAILSIAV